MMEINLQKISSLFESTQQENEGIMLIGSEGKFIFDYHSDRQEIDKELIGDLKALDENQIRSFLLRAIFILQKNYWNLNGALCRKTVSGF